MKSSGTRAPHSLARKVIALLALVQGSFGALRALDWVRIVLAVLFNSVLVFSAVIEGNSGMQTLLWMIVPAILAIYLLTPAGRQPQK